MSILLALLAGAATQKVSPDAAAKARAVFDPARLAAAERLREANGSEATLAQRVRVAATATVMGETADCLDLATDLPRNRRPDCTKIAQQQESDTAKLAAAIPAMVEQMRVVEQRAYAERYTAEEMDAVTAFLISPAWKKIVGDGADINADVTTKLRLLLRSTLNGTPAPPATAAPATKDAP